MRELEQVDAPRDLSLRLWEWGVSTAAVRNRADALGIGLTREVRGWLDMPTVRLLREYAIPDMSFAISERRRSATARRFPAQLCDKHEEGIAEGRLGKAMLAWMLGVDEDAVEVDGPSLPASQSPAELADLIGGGSE